MFTFPSLPTSLRVSQSRDLILFIIAIQMVSTVPKTPWVPNTPKPLLCALELFFNVKWSFCLFCFY